jgi:ATP-dependent exoDNAse (exonuclease V) alpha subunit
LQNGEECNYNPARLSGVTVFQQEERAFAIGERVQFRQPNKEKGIANGELATIIQIDHRSGNIALRMDRGKQISFNIKEWQHIDYGYAVTSFSSQSETAYRVLINVDTTLPATLINRRMAYVAISRASHEATIYTDNQQQFPVKKERG